MCRKAFCWVIGLSAATMFSVTFAQTSRAATILLKDTFNNAQTADVYGAGNNFGVNQELATRQSGSLGSISYVLNTTAATTPSKVNNAVAVPASAGMLSVDRPIGLDFNFNGAYGLGGLMYSVDVQAPSTNAPGWVLLGFGHDDTSKSTSGAANGLLVQFNGTAQFYKNTGTGSSGNAAQTPTFTWISGGAGTLKHTIDLVFNDPSDDNPFNGNLGGNLLVDVFVNGVQVDANGAAAGMSFSWGSDLANNYTGIWSSSTYAGGELNKFSFADNLTITNLNPIPEPSGLSLVLLGGVGLFGRGVRRALRKWSDV